jgi:hypothetical protein
MNEHETERVVRAWIESQPPLRAPTALRRSVMAIPTAAPMPLSQRLVQALRWRPAAVPRVAWALAVALLAAALVASTLYVGSRLLDGPPFLPRVPAVVPPSAVPSSSPPVSSPAPTDPPMIPVAVGCPALAALRDAAPALAAAGPPFGDAPVTVGQLSAAYDRYLEAAMTAWEATAQGGALPAMDVGSIDELGEAVDALRTSLPPEATLSFDRDTGDRVSTLIQTLSHVPGTNGAPAELWATACRPSERRVMSQPVQSTGGVARSPVHQWSCPRMSTAVERTTEGGWNVTVTRAGEPWLRVEMAPVAGSQGNPDAGMIPLTVRLRYEALAEGVWLDRSSLPVAVFAPTTAVPWSSETSFAAVPAYRPLALDDGFLWGELVRAEPAGAPALDAGVAVASGERLEATVRFDVPAEGPVHLIGRWLLPEADPPAWTHWTAPLVGGSRFCEVLDGAIRIR